jgi:hypothetical protein
MNTLHAPQGFSGLVKFLRGVVTDIGPMAPPVRLGAFPISPDRLAATGAHGQKSAARSIGWLWPLMGALLLAVVSAGVGQAALPADVPNIFDSKVQAHLQPVGVANLRGNPNFPALLLEDASDAKPQKILLGLDARNEKDTWSLKEDPIILIVVFSDPTTIKALYVDAGFADKGKASGDYKEVDEIDSEKLPDLLKAVTAGEAQTYI